MSELTMQTPRPPKAEDEGLTLQEIHWLPLAVPLCALLLLLVGMAVLSAA